MSEARHTPRTDAEECEIIPSRDPNYDGEYQWVPSRLARALERENAELLAALSGMVAIFDSVTQGQERELREEWLPKARAALSRARGEA